MRKAAGFPFRLLDSGLRSQAAPRCAVVSVIPCDHAPSAKDRAGPCRSGARRFRALSRPMVSPPGSASRLRARTICAAASVAGDPPCVCERAITKQTHSAVAPHPAHRLPGPPLFANYETNPSMENALSSPAVQERLVRSSRTFPSPSASVVLPIPAGARTSDGAFSRAFPEPEAEGAPPLRAADPSEISSSGRRGVKRSTIYSGSSKRSDVAMKKTDEGRHHSKLRRPTMGKPSGFVSGSSSRSSRPPRPGSTARRSGLTTRRPLGRGRCPLRSGQRRLVTPSAPQQGRHHPPTPGGPPR